MNYWKLLALGLLIICSYSGSVACPTGAATIPNCANCTTSGSTTVCSTCFNGYYLATTTCILCSTILPNCAYCEYALGSQLSCKSCQANYGLINGSCYNCTYIIGCISCQILSPSNSLQCTQCSTGLVLYNENTQCVVCQIANCAKCSVLINIFQCTSCQSGFFLSPNASSCLSCSTSIPYCASCLFDQNNRLVCAACASISLYLGNNSCLPNCSKAGMPNCAVCQIISLSNNTMLCLSCKANYFLQSASKTCQPCAQSLPGCTNCTSQLDPITNVSSTTCSACLAGYYLGGGSCVNCSTVKNGCNSCSYSFAVNTGQCTGCSSGFYLNATDSNCYSCSSTPYASGSYAINSCSICLVNVGTNTTTLVCSLCMPNFYLQNGFCLACSAAISNCSACEGDITNLRCTACLTGYILLSGSCKSCSMQYPNCSICSSVECTDCQSGYYTLDNKKCLPNCIVGNCQTCQAKNNAKCTSCNIGYTVNSLGTCSIIACSFPLQFNGRTCVCSYNNYPSGGQCIPCTDTNCLTCLDNKCTACQTGYYLSGFTCYRCMSSCQICISNNNCLLCYDGYYYSNGGCVLAGMELEGKIGVFLGQNIYQLCMVGCRVCTTILACSSCYDGFSLNGTVCLACPQNCKACVSLYDNITSSSTVSCIACQSGTALVSAALGCKPCSDPNCLNCDYNTEFCLQCTVTFSSDSTGRCLRCAENCDFCDINGVGKCDQFSCSIGFTRVSSTSCVKCLSGCASCNSEYPFTCLGCLVGTFNDTNINVCVNCPAECFSCKQYTSCSSCIDGYSLNNNTCIPLCKLPCISCKFTQNVNECTGCLQGYVLVNGICQPDFSCTSTLICEFCPLNYFAYRGNCYICSNNCRSCKFVTTDPAFSVIGLNYLPYLQCLLCSVGFFLQNNNCLPCQTGCLICQGQFNCLNCNTGLFLQYVAANGQSSSMSSLGICRKCLSVCSACDVSPNRCTGCQDGFYLSNFRCYSLSNVSYSFTLTPNSNSSNVSILGVLVGDISKIYKDIASAFGPSIVNNPYLLTIDSIVSGSVVISGTAGINSSSGDPSATYTSMTNSIQQTGTIGGLTVSSHSMQAQGFTPADTPAEATTNTVLYIIIGSSVGALLLVGIIVWLCIRYRRKSNSIQKDKGSEEEPATSKGMLKSDQGIAKSTVYDPPSKRRTDSSKKRQVSHISSNNSNSPRKNRNRHSSEETDQERYVQQRPSRRQNGRSKRNQSSRQEDYERQKREKEEDFRRDKNKSRRENTRLERENDRSKRQNERSRREYEDANNYDEYQAPKNRSRQPNHSREKNSKSNGKNSHRPKTSQHIEDQVQRPSVKYRSARDVSPQRPTIQHFKRESFEDDPPRQIERLQNNSNFSSQKTEKKGSKASSVSRKYIPNLNSHFI